LAEAPEQSDQPIPNPDRIARRIHCPEQNTSAYRGPFARRRLLWGELLDLLSKLGVITWGNVFAENGPATTARATAQSAEISPRPDSRFDLRPQIVRTLDD
jgi:hypothetical protein